MARFQRKDNVVVIMPTLSKIDDNVSQYIRCMLENGYVFNFVVFDEGTVFREKNRERVENLKEEFGNVPIYYFGREEKRRFFGLLEKEGVPSKLLDIINEKPSYANARTKEFMIATLLGADYVMSFDDDTYPHDRKIFRKHYSAIAKARKPALIEGDYVGERGTDYTMFKSSSAPTKKFLQEFFKVLERPEPKGGYKVTRLKRQRMMLGGNFMINKVYKEIVCAPVIKTHGSDEFFPTDMVLRKGGRILQGTTVLHKHGEDWAGKRVMEYFTRSYMLSFVRRHLMYYLLSEMEREYGDIYIKDSGWAKAFIFDKEPVLVEVVGNYRADLARLNQEHKNPNVRLLCDALAEEGVAEKLAEQTTHAIWNFVVLHNAWPKVMDAIGNVDKEAVF